MPNELILTDSGRIELPPAQHQGFTALAKVVQRMPAYVPSGADPRQLLMAIVAEANKQSLAKCTPVSIVKTAFNCAVLGLVPGEFMGMAHFVPFKNTKNNCTDCVLVVGYKGWLELAYDGDFLRDVHAEVVLKGEDFERWNDEAGPHIRHKLDLERDDGLVWENVEAAYCVWHSRGGGSGLEIVGRKALQALKRRGQVWDTSTRAMCPKTPILRASKTCRRTRRIALAGALEDAVDAELPQPSLVSPHDAEPQEEAPKLEAFDEQGPSGWKEPTPEEQAAYDRANPVPKENP